jgi:hypothetical protein
LVVFQQYFLFHEYLHNIIFYFIQKTHKKKLMVTILTNQLGLFAVFVYWLEEYLWNGNLFSDLMDASDETLVIPARKQQLLFVITKLGESEGIN